MNCYLVLPLLLQPLQVPRNAQQPTAVCPPGITDQSQPGNCIGAASTPTPGSLLPIGPYFWVGAAGDVGINTQNPAAQLHVAGDVIAEGLLAAGNDTNLGGHGDWSYRADVSSYIDQFPGIYSVGLHSQVTYDPQVDLTGQNTGWLWSHFFTAKTADTNDRDIDALFGATSYAFPRGTGTVTYVLGSGGVAENDAGHVIDQAGGAFTSLGDHDSTIGINTWLYVRGGHKGMGGSVQTDYGIYVETPSTSSPLFDHYGLYLDDQDVGVNDSYAIYSAGGTSFLAGDLGVGNPTPAAKLDVDGDLVVSGTKSFRQAHPNDPSLEIWFVCLEGNEAGTYFRGSGALTGGRAEITVPEEFALVTDPEGLTVQVTPMGDARLWVERKSLTSVVIRGDSDVAFDYMVNGVRAGYSDFETIRQAPLPAVETPKGRSYPFPIAAPATDDRRTVRSRRQVVPL